VNNWRRERSLNRQHEQMTEVNGTRIRIQLEFTRRLEESSLYCKLSHDVHLKSESNVPLFISRHGCDLDERLGGNRL
jgi:hypothetical protein